MMPTKVLIATTNAGKSKEIMQLFPWQVTWLRLSDFPSVTEVEEVGSTFNENAMLKAVGYAKQTGVLTVAEDSGLLVDALDGEPGVFSRRYGHSDEERIAKILTALKDVPWEKRTASFHCVAVLHDPETEKSVSKIGRVDGIITTEPKGKSGFGYDPIFYFPPEKLTFAEMGERKNSYSHRRRAFEALMPELQKLIKQ